MFYHRQEAAGQRQKPQEHERSDNLKIGLAAAAVAPLLRRGVLFLRLAWNTKDGIQTWSPLKLRHSQRIHILEPRLRGSKLAPNYAALY